MKCTCVVRTDDQTYRFDHMPFCSAYLKRSNKIPQKMNLAGGKATSSKIPPFKFIPLWAAEALAEIFGQGARPEPEGHGEKSWNALAPSFHEVNGSKDWVIERLSHVIHHALKALAEVSGQCEPSGENHAGAILFGGSVLACYLREKGNQPKPSSLFKVSIKEPCHGETLFRVFVGSIQIAVRDTKEAAEEFVKILEEEINGF